MTVTERFLRYVTSDTTSCEASETVPSTPSQLAFGKALVCEMQALGMQDVRIDGMGYVYGTLPATPDRADAPALGLIAHMDTSPAVSGCSIHPQILRYTGGTLELGNGIALDPATYPSLERYMGEELIVTDGTTLLGADDKAGIAEILSAVEYLINHPEVSHRTLSVAFTPDEEIGRGADHFDVAHFGASVAYTVDGGELGEIEYENFNAAAVQLTVHGINIHPGSAKGRMKNAILMANQFISLLPPAETPAHTEGYEGFYHITDLCGDESKVTLSMLIRDHDMQKFEERKAFIHRLCSYLNGEWGEGSFEVSIRDSYYNMKEKLLPHLYLVENAEAAMRAVGAEPCVSPIRGGTDGARLSFMGLPCPNLSTGGANFHSIHEFIPVRSLEKMTEVLVRLAQ